MRDKLPACSTVTAWHSLAAWLVSCRCRLCGPLRARSKRPSSPGCAPCLLCMSAAPRSILLLLYSQSALTAVAVDSQHFSVQVTGFWLRGETLANLALLPQADAAPVLQV